MTDHAAAAPIGGQPTPILTLAEAQADRAARARQQARHCVILAVVTTPPVAADLIDRAIDLTREIGDGAAAAPPPSRAARTG